MVNECKESILNNPDKYKEEFATLFKDKNKESDGAISDDILSDMVFLKGHNMNA